MDRMSLTTRTPLMFHTLLTGRLHTIHIARIRPTRLTPPGSKRGHLGLRRRTLSRKSGRGHLLSFAFGDDPMRIDVTFDAAVFSLDTVKAACYVFLDRFTSDFELSGSRIVCHLVFQDGVSQVAAEAHVDRFKKELLDQDLRRKLKSETEPIRNLILAHAFSKTGLIADE